MLVMGIINVTPDSFSDGGQWLDTSAAIAHGFDLVEDGADILDIGAESTRPGYCPVSAPEQINRLVPVLQGLRDAGVPLSVDTTSAAVAHAAITAGATIVNDVSGGLADETMMAVVAQAEVDYVCQLWTRWPNHDAPSQMQGWTHTRDELLYRRNACIDAGVNPRRIIIDPGLGFGKHNLDNWQILAHIEALTQSGNRVLVGASRKRFLGAAHKPLASTGESTDHGDTAVTAWCAARGVWAVRVHDAGAHARTIEVTDQLLNQVGGGDS